MASPLPKISHKQALLLHVVSTGSDLRTLTSEGLTHSQIALLLSQSEHKKLLHEVDGHLLLTDLGKSALRSIPSSSFRPHNLWIWPLQDDFVAKSDINDVYLPPAVVVAKLAEMGG